MMLAHCQTADVSCGPVGRASSRLASASKVMEGLFGAGRLSLGVSTDPPPPSLETGETSVISDFVPISRRLFRGPFWNSSEPFDKRSAWIDLIQRARYGTRRTLDRGIEITIERGQVLVSEDGLAERWNWSRGKVRRYIALLHRLLMVVSEPASKQASRGTILTLCNYPTYNPSVQADGTADGTAVSRHRAGTEPSKKKEVRKKEEKDTGGASEFGTFWERYPKREGGNPKARALAAWNKRIREGCQPDEIIAGLERYVAYLTAAGMVGGRMVMHASTFVGPDKRWTEDWSLPSTNGKADVEQLVADVLYLVEQGGTILDIPDEREHALEDLSRKHPVQWGRAGPWMENLKLGRIRGEGGRDREHEIRTQIRQLNGVVHG